jgi:ribonuclease HI
VQSTLLYGAELWWDGKAPTRQFQLAINRLARGTLGCFQSIPLGPLLVEAGMTPAIPLLNYRQSRHAQRLLGMPCDSPGPQEILDIEGSPLAQHLSMASLLPEGCTEPTFLAQNMIFPGIVLSEWDLEDALATALAWTDLEDTAWTDGSRLEDGRVGCSVVWKEEGRRWRSKAFYLGRNKEVFDAELRAIYEAVFRSSSGVTPGRRYTVFADAQAAIQRRTSDFRGPGQYLARLIIDKARVITNAGSMIEIRWVPGHKGVPGNEEADRQAKRGAKWSFSEVGLTPDSSTPLRAEHTSNIDLPRRSARNPLIGGLRA